MKHTMFVLLLGGIASVITVPLVAAFFAQTKRDDSGELRERDEIRQTFKLAPGTRVEVSSIRGPVEIETADIEVAEVHIVRSAQSRADLGEFKIGIENKPQSLVIAGETRQRNSGSGFGPDVRHHVMLRLPRRIDLSVRSVSGQVRIGDVDGQIMVSSVSGSFSIGTVDGQLQLSSVSGSVDIGQVKQQAEIKSASGNVTIGQVMGSLDVSSVSGTLSAGISKLGERGVRINSVSGQVELRFTGELNAQLSTDSISGKVSIEVPNVTMQSSPNAAATRALIGKGGPPISIKGVSKGVRLAQGT
ncbi:MAG: DUF4097 family beta strand repeat-containing protein [Pyrinomonadaceae bacterium]